MWFESLPGQQLLEITLVSFPAATWIKGDPSDGTTVTVDADGVSIWPDLQRDGFEERSYSSIEFTRGEWLDLVAAVERAHREMDDGN